jgi:hypothetical protein
MVGVVLALAALAWQARSFRQSGSRVRVTITSGLRDRAQAVKFPQHMPVHQELALRAQGLTQPILAVEVTNSGRSPTSVQSVSIRFPNGGFYSPTHVDPELPFRLEPESEQTWVFPRGDIVSYGQAMGHEFSAASPMTLCGSAKLGGRDKPLVSKNHIDLRPTV